MGVKMKKDITIDVGNDYILNCRATGIIIHNNKILFHHNLADVYYALMGGRVHIGEDSKKAVLREFYEELNKEVYIVKDLTTIENFFNHKGKKYHEISFVYQLEFLEEEDRKIEKTLHCVEESEKHVQYEWISIEDLDKYDIRPQNIVSIIKNNNWTAHTINKN